MSQAEPQTPAAKLTWRARLANLRTHVSIGVSEVMFLVGLACLFFGTWIWMGLGQALFSVGCILISVAILNGLTKSMEAKNAV